MKNVIIYSTPTCHFCHMAKDYFAENNIEYTEYNVAEDAEKRAEMMEKTGQMGVPVIEINNEIVIGFNEAKIKELLASDAKVIAMNADTDSGDMAQAA
ncbi:glutaredoxin family protein [Patescibacteria group bacterium]|nr:glutaredoxin family protein [Patescibacteria group bacterium]